MSGMKELLYDREITAFTIAERRQEIRQLQKQIRELKQVLASLPKDSPTGGRGLSRKTNNTSGRVWNDPSEILCIVDLFKIAGTQPKLRTSADRVCWVAKQSGIWKAGTVHVQFSIARKQGLIPDARAKVMPRKDTK